MTLEFKIADFAYPFSIPEHRRTFEKNQWLSQDKQIDYQESRLRRIVEHAYKRVPYYRELFDQIGLKPGDIKTIADLPKIPVLGKSALRENFVKLQAIDASRYRPQKITTSGTTGRRLEFLVDKPSNVLEFTYYWRHWNWAGYRLGNPFAEFSNHFFNRNEKWRAKEFHYQRLPNRLLLNSNVLSTATVDRHVAAIRRHRPRFLKGLASVLYHFALFLKGMKIDDLWLKAIFSTGEKLLPHQRRRIEATFRCKVFDSYGHMERTVAISECPMGSLHVNTDYGLAEFIRQDEIHHPHGASQSPAFIAKIIGTSLYNLSMPLLRYEVGDFVRIEANRECLCGRLFPLVASLEGRQSEVIMTPEGKVITAMFLVFEEVEGIYAGQIVQETLDELLIRIVPAPNYLKVIESTLVSRVQSLVGPMMKIRLERCQNIDELQRTSGKIQVVVSKLEDASLGVAAQHHAFSKKATEHFYAAPLEPSQIDDKRFTETTPVIRQTIKLGRGEENLQ